MKEDAMKRFGSQMTQKLGKRFSLKWDVDRKGVVCGWCRLDNPEDIFAVAEIVAGFKGRVMTISALNTPSGLTGDTGILLNPAPVDSEPEKEIRVVINYHFFFDGVNCTVGITLPDKQRTVKSITPVLISADWHEREMQELYNIKLQGHPNSKRLFLEKNIAMTDHTMIPLSEALRGASTNVLWERIMKTGGKEAKADE